jgi:hypothetical protein
MTFQPSASNGARWRLIETNGVLFAVLKRRVLQKRHQPPPEKISGLSFDTAMYPHKYKNLHENPRWANKINRKWEKIHTVRPAGLKTRRSFSYTITTRNSLFLTVLLLFAQCKMNYWWLVTWHEHKHENFLFFDCAVALCTLKNSFLVSRNLSWL